MSNNFNLSQFDNVLMISAKVDNINELTTDAGCTIEGVLIKDNQLSIDAISEKTIGSGVSIDNLLIKDGMCQYSKTSNVTQTTSITTSVTSNGVAGQITTVNASIALNSTVSFVVNNNSCLSTSFILLQPVSFSGVLGPPAYFVSSVTDGSFQITILNPLFALLTGSHVLKYIIV